MKKGLNCSRDLNPLGSDIGYNFHVKSYSMRFSSYQMNRPKLDTILKKLKFSRKTQFGFSLSNSHVQVIIEQNTVAISKSSFDLFRRPVFE